MFADLSGGVKDFPETALPCPSFSYCLCIPAYDNRAGEAEKSHQKAKNQGFRDHWTIISKAGLNIDKLQSESPTTRSWFDVAHVLGREGTDWNEFRSRFADATGIPLSS
jgi:hypothetical protein